MAGIDYSFDPELQAQQEAIQHRQKMSELLMSRAIPQTHIVGRMSPWQALAQVVSAGAGGYMQNKNIEENKKLATDYDTKLKEGVRDYMLQRTGRAGQTQDTSQEGTGSFDMSGSQGPANVAAIPADPRGAMVNAMVSRNPLVRNLGTIDYQHELKRTDPYTLPEGASRFEGSTPVSNNPKTPEHALPASWESHIPPGAKVEGPGTVRMRGADGQDDLYTMEFDRGQYRGLKKLDSSPKPPTINNNNPAPVTVTTVANPNKPGETLQVDARVYKGGGEGSPGVIGSGQKLTQTGTAALKLETAKPEAQSRVTAVNQNLDRLTTALQTLHDHKGLSGITGTVYGRTPALTNNATGALAHLESIHSQIFQASLQAMRETSKTGGAVGNVSDKEGDKFEKTIAALNRSMGTKEFQGEIKKAQAQLELSKQRINQAFKEQYGNTENFVPPKAGAGATGAPPPPAGFTPVN